MKHNRGCSNFFLLLDKVGDNLENIKIHESSMLDQETKARALSTINQLVRETRVVLVEDMVLHESQKFQIGVA